jgi:hypothetical protein
MSTSKMKKLGPSIKALKKVLINPNTERVFESLGLCSIAERKVVRPQNIQSPAVRMHRTIGLKKALKAS